VLNLDKYINSVLPGDCLKVMGSFPDQSIDLVVSDPPYGMEYKSGKWHGHYVRGKHKTIQKNISRIVNDDIVVNFLPEISRVLKPDGALYVFGTYRTVDLWKPYIQSYFKLRNIMVWIKNNHTMGSWKSQYRNKYELIYYADKGSHVLRGHKGHTDVLYYNRVKDSKRKHPTEKPVDLCEALIEESSNRGDIVLDPFCGSGSTLVAAKNLDRRYIGIEIDKEFSNIAKERLEG
jgi:site-specific DNA-methyltransferase (adenine-specific)